MTLEACGLGYARGDRQLFRELGFRIAPGEAVRIAGRNGSGKSSLLRLLGGLALPDEGEVCWHGRDIREVRDSYLDGLLYLGHATALKDDLSAMENLVTGEALRGIEIDRHEAHRALGEWDLGAAAMLPARSLSQGQRRRVGLARLSLGMSKALWILDEPFTALDAEAAGALIGTIDRYLADGGMLVYTTHQEASLKSRHVATVDLDVAGLA